MMKELIATFSSLTPEERLEVIIYLIKKEELPGDGSPSSSVSKKQSATRQK